MPRTAIPVQELTADGGGIAELTWTAADAANDHYFDNTSGKILLLCRTITGAGQTVTIESVADERGRTRDRTLVTAANGISIAGVFDPPAWNQRGASDLGQVFVNITDATGLTFAAVQVGPPK